MVYVAPTFRWAFAGIHNVGLKADATKALPGRVVTIGFLSLSSFQKTKEPNIPFPRAVRLFG